jgi:hypothetical protein
MKVDGLPPVVFYRSDDSEMQIYQSSREGEVNCMIAPLIAANELGLRANKWQYLTRFSKRPDIPLVEPVEVARAQYTAYANPLEWVRDRIVKHYESAHAGFLNVSKRIRTSKRFSVHQSPDQRHPPPPSRRGPRRLR